MAQLVQHLPRMQKITGSSPARGNSSFSLSREKEELSLGVIACICLVSITDYSCVVGNTTPQAGIAASTCSKTKQVGITASCIWVQKVPKLDVYKTYNHK